MLALSPPARRLRRGAAAAFALSAGAVALAAAQAGAAHRPFLDRFPAQTTIASTVPANGDVNPYGTVVVPRSTGDLRRGDVLVSNFNDAANAQGTGTTIVQVSPEGAMSLFAQLDPARLPGPCPGGIGLTTALTVLGNGDVVVGSLPTSDGSAATAQPGCLIVLSPRGTPLATISGPPIDGPWDMTSVTSGDRDVLFVTNVLDGTVAASPNVVDNGTVVRLVLDADRGRVPRLLSERVIATGFEQRTDPGALVIGPTGVGLGDRGTLYVADTLSNRIAAVDRALTRTTPATGGARTVSSGASLNGPLGLAVAPNGDLLTANGNDGNLVETTPRGGQVATRLLDPAGAGVLFGLAVAPRDRGVYFVDDGDNTLRVLHR